MRILLTNDDGINAPGLKVLEAIARTLSDDIWIVAPQEEQSGAGHSLTLSRPVRVRKHDARRWSVSGTPTDAVMMALGVVMGEEKPDLILSGVNRGANLAEDVTYSGTVSAAMEGTLAGYRSIALSQVYAREGMGDTVPFAAAEAWGERVLRPLIVADMPPRTLINVNFPAGALEDLRGVKVVEQGFHDYGRAKIVKGVDPRGYPYYWFGLGATQETPGHATDLEAIAEGFITVTPLHLDLTHYGSIPLLPKRLQAVRVSSVSGGWSRLAALAALTMLSGCIPPGATPAPVTVSAPTIAETPKLSLDLTQLKDVPPSWEMRRVTAAALEVRSATYVVKAGDTLRGIGEATGAGSEAIARANALIAPYVVKPGQSLAIPGGRYHRVREGETGIAIARAYGVAWRSIIESNALTEPFTLRVGQRLVLPGTAATASTPVSPEARAAAFQIGIDDVVTGSEPARTAEAVTLAKPASTGTAAAVRFVWPVGGSIVGRFGPQGSGRINQGIDIAAPSGAGVRAASAGTIAYVGTGVPGYGGLILVRHDGGWISAYGRVASAAVAKGDTVKAGQTLGKSSGEPLHFELRRARVPVDPVKYLPTR